MSGTGLLWHGGAKGLIRGDTIDPDMAHTRYVEGCACCEDHKRREKTVDPATPDGWVYATSHRLYGRYYASRAVGGDLYKVRLKGEIEQSTEDHFPTWRARAAVVEKVVARNIILSMRERRNLFLKWGGTIGEFENMVVSVAMSGAIP